MAVPTSMKGRRRPKVPDDPEEFKLTLGEHLDELRTRIVRIALLIFGGWVAGWYAQPWVYRFLNELVHRNVKGHQAFDFKDAFTNATDPFMLKLKLSLLLGFVLVAPFCVMQLWGFVKPGLKAAERRPVGRVAPFSVLLFFLGGGFCWLVIPSAIHWFASYMEEFPGTVLYQEPGKMVFFILKMLLAFGLGFQLPLVVFLLGKIGLLTPETLLQYWRQSAVAIFTIAMIVTPSNDAFSMLMMAIPLCVLFILSVFLVKWTTKRPPSDSSEDA